MTAHLLANTPNDIHVNLLSGKISKSGKRKPLSQQKGSTCVLYSMRRIGFFNQTNKNNKAIKAYKNIKNALKTCYDTQSIDYVKLVNLAESTCKECQISANDIYQSKNFENFYTAQLISFPNQSKQDCYTSLDLETKWVILYNLIIEKILMPLMNIKGSTWHPQQGIAALKKSLEENGAHYFMGKLGENHHTEDEIIKEESTPSRTVYKVKENNFSTSPLVHAVIVDQIKTINGIDMVFFRDPMFDSIPGKPEKIFSISYENFVKRLTDNCGYRFTNNECNSNSVFGMVTEFPENLCKETSLVCHL